MALLDLVPCFSLLPDSIRGLLCLVYIPEGWNDFTRIINRIIEKANFSFFYFHVSLYYEDNAVYIEIVVPDSFSRTYRTSHKSIEIRVCVKGRGEQP